MRYTRVRIKTACLVAVAASVSPALLLAQEIPGGNSPFGVRESVIPQDAPPPPPAEEGLVLVTAPGPLAPRYQIQFTPSAVAANGLNAYGANLGMVTDSLLPGRAFLRGGYRRLDLVAEDDRHRWLVDARLPVTRGGRSGIAAAVTGEYSRTTVAGSKYKVGAALDRKLLNQLSIGATGFFVGNDDAEDVGLAASVTYLISDESSLEFGYRLPNDVETERDYSLTLTQFLFRTRGNVATRLVLGAARDRAVLATLSFVR